MTRPALLFLVAALFTSSVSVAADADDGKAVEQLQRALNNAYLKQDVEAIKRLTGEDLIVVTGQGVRETRAEQLKGLADLKLTEYLTEDVQVALPAKDTAVVTFRSTLKGAVKGKPLDVRQAGAAVWVRRGGAWVEVFYQGTPLPAK